MKSTLIIAILLIFNVAFGRGLNPSSQDFGGIAVPDPHESMDKKGTRDQKLKAQEIMAQLYGQSKTDSKNEETDSKSSAGSK